ncbi:unnamed protein product [Paramecium sonneborni]|uniref:VWFA domain-containing protein n=1 Tax=Paramecium sonneborni TaxID=65129 RepID=A0A8S1LIC1_9CILI|nr:unnamed protein product [Paramecium sonneborni]
MIKNVDNYEVFMAQECSTSKSYLITLIDGTGSMHYEYQTIIEAHDNVFSVLGQNQLKFQWEEQLYDLLPFREAERGDITKTFQTILKKLEIEDYPKNITIVFVSDGQEPFEFNELKDQIDKIKEKYLIQFISLAVGDQFPNTISNILRNSIHNQNASCPALFEIARDYKPLDQLKQEFIDIFNKIKLLLEVQSHLFKVNQPVYQTIGSKNPTYLISPNEPFLKINNGLQQKVLLEGKELKPTLNPTHISQLIINSVQQELIEAAAKQDSNYPKTFQKMNQIIQNILSQITVNKDENNQETVQLVVPLVDIVTRFGDGNLKINELDQSKLTILQKNIKKKEEINNFIEFFGKKEIKVEQIPSKEKVEEEIKVKLNKAKLGCFIRSKSTNKQLDLVQSIWTIVSQGLADYKKLILQDETLNIQNLLRQFKNILDEQLDKIFKFEKFENLNSNQHMILRKLNLILKELERLIFETQQISIAQLIKFIDSCQNFNVESFELESVQSTEFVKEVDQYQFLPQTLQPQVIQPIKKNTDDSIIINILVIAYLIAFIMETTLQNVYNYYSN